MFLYFSEGIVFDSSSNNAWSYEHWWNMQRLDENISRHSKCTRTSYMATEWGKNNIDGTYYISKP